jgi:hypothetical protein
MRCTAAMSAALFPLGQAPFYREEFHMAFATLGLCPLV